MGKRIKYIDRYFDWEGTVSIECVQAVLNELAGLGATHISIGMGFNEVSFSALAFEEVDPIQEFFKEMPLYGFFTEQELLTYLKNKYENE